MRQQAVIMYPGLLATTCPPGVYMPDICLSAGSYPAAVATEPLKRTQVFRRDCVGRVKKMGAWLLLQYHAVYVLAIYACMRHTHTPAAPTQQRGAKWPGRQAGQKAAHLAQT